MIIPEKAIQKDGFVSIKVSKGNILVDDFFYNKVFKTFKWYITKNGYVVGRPKIVSSFDWKKDYPKVMFLLHRFVMEVLPDRNVQVDHINGDKLDNRKRNLRLCSSSQNNSNRRKSIGRRYKGVSRSGYGSRWRAVISKDGKFNHLGTFRTQLEAAKAYDKAAVIAHGEFALLNGIKGSE